MIEQRKIVIDEIDNKTREISNRVSTDGILFPFLFYLCISVASSSREILWFSYSCLRGKRFIQKSLIFYLTGSFF